MIELSIVLVIIGLIVGGVVSGRALIHQAEIRALSQDIAKIQVAFHAFNLQYDAIPGDMRDAADYWSTATNGNGNSQLDGGERIQTWEHLKLATLLDFGTDVNNAGIGVGKIFPSSPMKEVGYALYTWSDNVSLPQRIHIQIGRYGFGSTYIAGFVPKDAYAIDKKYDDGLARQGQYMASRSGGSGDDGSRCNLNNAYRLDFASIGCRLHVYLEK